MKKSELRQIIKEELDKVLSKNQEDAKKLRDEKIKLFSHAKVGDKMKYIGPDARGFKSGGIYTVAIIKSNSVLEKTIVLKSDNSKLKLAIPFKNAKYIEKAA